MVPKRRRADRARLGAGCHVTAAGEQLVGRRSDGGEFPADISVSTIGTAGGVLVSTTFRDVTEPRPSLRRWIHQQESGRGV